MGRREDWPISSQLFSSLAVSQRSAGPGWPRHQKETYFQMIQTRSRCAQFVWKAADHPGQRQTAGGWPVQEFTFQQHTTRNLVLLSTRLVRTGMWQSTLLCIYIFKCNDDWYIYTSLSVLRMNRKKERKKSKYIKRRRRETTSRWAQQQTWRAFSLYITDL